MSNHFTGLSLGPPLGDQRLDLCDLYAFQSLTDKNKTVIILNANPNADALHPDAIYRVNIDTDGDYLTDIAFSYVFSQPQNGKQTVSVFMAKGAESRSPEAVGTKIIADADVSRWAAKVDNPWLEEDLTWFSGAANREVRAPRRLLVTHFFTHQTHHRGQVHAMLTAAGQQTGDTDLFLLVPLTAV